MGNQNPFEIIKIEIDNMVNFLKNGNYTEAKKVIDENLVKVKEIRDAKDKKELLNLLIEKVKNEKISEFITIIKYLKIEDKILLLSKLLYDSNLIDSIEEFDEQITNIEEDTLIINIEDNNLVNKWEKEIKEMKRISNHVYLEYTKSFLFEKIAENYYKIAKKYYYYNFSLKRLENQSLEDLEYIIDCAEECISYYKKTKNNKIELKKYDNFLSEIKSKQNLLLGNEELKKEKYLEAINYYEKINCINQNINKKRDENILLCYQELAKIEEEKAQYEKNIGNIDLEKFHYTKAIDYYKKVKNNNKLFKLTFILDKIIIEEIIKKNESSEIINYFDDIFEILNNLKKEENHNFFSSITSDILILLVRLSIISLKKNCLKKFIYYLENYDMEEFKNEKINSLKIELILELKKYQQIPEINKLLYTKESLKPDNSEIKHRLYLSALIIKYLKDKGDEIISLLINEKILLKYLTIEGYAYFLDYFKELKVEKEFDLNIIYSASKLLNLIINSIFDYSKIALTIIGQKIIDIFLYSKSNNSKKFTKFFEILIISFQELLINNTEIKQKEYEELFQILLIVINVDIQYVNIVSKGLLFLSDKNIDFNLIKNKNLFEAIKQYSFKNENFIQILISQFRFQKKENIEFFIDNIYKILLECQKMEVYESNEEKIINFLINLLPISNNSVNKTYDNYKTKFMSEVSSINNVKYSNILLNKKYLLKLQEYLKGKNIHPLCYKLIERIPDENRYPIMTEKLKNFQERNSSIKINSKNTNLKDRLAFMLTITKNELIEIEKKLDEKYFIKKLILYLNRQKDLINDINIEEITKHFSLDEIDLLNLIIENKIIFNEKSLINLLKGFYMNDKMIYETLKIFNKIKFYQKKIPFIIEKNLNIEEFLSGKNYEHINTYEPFLTKVFEDFSFLKGFSKQHQDFILYLLNLKGEVPKDIIQNTTLNFLINKNYNIGMEVYEKILKEINLEELIIYIPDVLINKFLSEFHNITFNKLYSLLKNEIKDENILLILKSFKFFVDYIELPDSLIELLISLLQRENKKEINKEINKEIIYIIGNYFSIKENSLNQNKYLESIINIISENKLYKYIRNNIKTINNENEFFYLFACVNYFNYSIESPFKEINILKIPQNSIINYMKTINENLDDNLISEYIMDFNNYFNFGDFSPERDHYLRKLYFNNKKYSIYKLKLLCD